MNYRLTETIPVVFHNLRGYDGHLIMQEIGKFGLSVGVIPNNMDRYQSFTLSKPTLTAGGGMHSPGAL